MNASLKVKIDRMKAVLKSLDSLALNNVLVGVPENTADKGAVDRANKTAGGVINNAALAAIHEYGAPQAGIHARPFLMPGIEKAKEQCAADLREGAKAVLKEDNPAAARKALNNAGLHAAREVQNQFKENNWEPLKRSRSKKGRSYNKSDKSKRSMKKRDMPLIDTGALRSSITYEIKQSG